jgi:hypothetical protein
MANCGDSPAGRQRLKMVILALLVLLLPVACAGPEAAPAAVPTVAPMFAEGQAGSPPGQAEPGGTAVTPAGTAAPQPPPADFFARIDATQDVHPISPLIYGVSGAPAEYLAALRPALNSWGGNPSSRYNWRLGNAWNAANDWEYRNVDYGEGANEAVSASDSFVESSLAAGAAVRIALPTLGWVAKDNDDENCSFPLPGGGCGTAGGADCRHPGEIADPARTSVASTPEDIVDWVRHMLEAQAYDVRFLAMDNEPELWGYTHYDVHPECTTYQEILDRYLAYARAVRQVAPGVELTGPVTCCWTFYWDSAAGLTDKASHGFEDFLPWFLGEVTAHDDEFGQRTLDVLDIHYYPEGVFNDESDPATAAQRLRSTRSLWDPNYLDESWIWLPIQLIPRMKGLAEGIYPGTKVGISEWNWGADESLNGALAIADVLGIYGREDLYFAAYWRYPALGSPGFQAFKLYTNYDGQGGRFGDTSVRAESFDPDRVATYAALDSASGVLHLLLVKKLPVRELTVQVELEGFVAAGPATAYRYDAANLAEIVADSLEVGRHWFDIRLPAYSITHLVVEGDG